MHPDIVEKRLDLRHLRWTERTVTSGTSGCLLKSRELVGNTQWYYKLSCYDSYRGIYGHECINEVIASRLMTCLGISHLEYELLHALVTVEGVDYDTWINRTRSFRQPGERKIELDMFYDFEKQAGERPLELIKRFGWAEEIEAMMVIDFIIANRDRHGANIEVLKGRDGSIRLAPLFDNGLSFVCFLYDDENRIREFDPLQDVVANNYLGTRSLEENIRRFVNPDLIGLLVKNHPIDDWLSTLFVGLDPILPQVRKDKISQIISERWKFLEDLCDSQHS